jgi:hypothetical protein
VQCTKQKGTALMRYPSAPLVWLPQQFTAPCRNQTSDSPAYIAMGVPDGLRENIRKNCRCVDVAGDFDHEAVSAITKSSAMKSSCLNQKHHTDR